MAKPQSKGLPMTSKWDPEKLQRDIAELDALAKSPLPIKVAGYIKRSGPGLLQSAMTLGAGSAAASVVAGASFGYKLLWVQPIAMFLGIMMMAALGNIVLTTGERPYRAFGENLSRRNVWLGKSLVFLWALGTILASIIWHFPQYGLAAGAARDLASMVGVTVADTAGKFTQAGIAVSFGIGLAILAINLFTTWNYGSSAKGIKIYEWFLRGMIALVIVSFGIVVVANIGKIQWGEMAKGFAGGYGIPRVDPAVAERAAAETTGLTKPEAMNSLTLVLGMLGNSVGINMTFLYPYSLLAKGWGKHHKVLSRWDLFMSMFLPFILVTSLVMLAMTVSDVYDPTMEVVRSNMKPLVAAGSLTGVLGENLGRVIFDLGLMGMSCGAISVHMVVCGFTMCEMLGLEYTKARYRMCTLVPVIGILGVVTPAPFWFPIAASAVCFTMLPIAYLIFLIMNNRKSYIGDATGHGIKRVLLNTILIVALSMTVIGMAIQLKQNVYGKIKGMMAPKQETSAPAEKK